MLTFIANYYLKHKERYKKPTGPIYTYIITAVNYSMRIQRNEERGVER